MFDVKTERVAMKWAYIIRKIYILSMNTYVYFIFQVDFNLFEMCSNPAKGEVYNIMG